MASRFGKMVLGIFFDADKMAANNARFKARIAEIDEENANVKEAIKNTRAANKAAFMATIDANTAKRKSQLKAGRY